MPVRFEARITPSVNRTLTRRYMPHIQFEFSNVRFGLTFLEEVKEMLVGRSRPAHITMLGHSDMAAVAENIAVGSKFALYEGPRQVASGTVDEVEEKTLDH
jgi:translation elongation factor EF-Tu-like GTPase